MRSLLLGWPSRAWRAQPRRAVAAIPACRQPRERRDVAIPGPRPPSDRRASRTSCGRADRRRRTIAWLWAAPLLRAEDFARRADQRRVTIPGLGRLREPTNPRLKPASYPPLRRMAVRPPALPRGPGQPPTSQGEALRLLETGNPDHPQVPRVVPPYIERRASRSTKRRHRLRASSLGLGSGHVTRTPRAAAAHEHHYPRVGHGSSHGRVDSRPCRSIQGLLFDAGAGLQRVSHPDGAARSLAATASRCRRPASRGTLRRARRRARS